jgi:hypothetical protein
MGTVGVLPAESELDNRLKRKNALVGKPKI